MCHLETVWHHSLGTLSVGTVSRGGPQTPRNRRSVPPKPSLLGLANCREYLRARLAQTWPLEAFRARRFAGQEAMKLGRIRWRRLAPVTAPGVPQNGSKHRTPEAHARDEACQDTGYWHAGTNHPHGTYYLP